LNENKLIYLDSTFTEAQRDIIKEFQRLHLNQQSNERDFVNKKKFECQQLDQFGQPKIGMLYSDGMTVMSCNTPKFGRHHHSSGSQSNVIESRVIGVEVYCGPINTVYLYYTDNLVSGGANIMIEVQRQALLDLSKQLSLIGCKMPSEFIFQFDNCGENKVCIFFEHFFNLYFHTTYIVNYSIEQVFVFLHDFTRRILYI
jgi:hypothetical protein